MIQWSEFSAYFYGFMLGDGCITRPCITVAKSGKQYVKKECIKIYCIDSDIIERFAEEFKVHVSSYVPKCNGMECNRVYGVCFRSDEWVSWLMQLGMTYNKSKNGCIISLPPDKYIRHFVRGLFDSDGCVTKHHEKLPSARVSIAGHPSYMNVVN